MWTNSKEEIIEGILRHGPDILENCVVGPDFDEYLERIKNEHLSYPIPKKQLETSNWLIPESYKTMDIEQFIIDQTPIENQQRSLKELELYKKYGMIDILKTMKYIVDTLRKHNILWGVGRGSSVASYVLHILGVHKIDSVKYNIPISEFFKGEHDG